MSDLEQRRLGPFLRDVVSFQLKLAFDAMREIALIPLAMGAALLDLLLIRKQAPRYFRAAVEFAQRTEMWVDHWGSAIYGRYGPRSGKVDSLLAHIEAVLRDPQSGPRKARVLKRWAEMQLARSRRAANALQR